MVSSPMQLTDGSDANLVLFVSWLQALIKIICSDCLGKLFFVLTLPSLYQNNFRGSRFLCGGVHTALRRDGGRMAGGHDRRQQSQTSWNLVRWDSQTLHCPLHWVPENNMRSLVVKEATSFDQGVQMKENLNLGYYNWKKLLQGGNERVQNRFQNADPPSHSYMAWFCTHTEMIKRMMFGEATFAEHLLCDRPCYKMMGLQSRVKYGPYMLSSVCLLSPSLMFPCAQSASPQRFCPSQVTQHHLRWLLCKPTPCFQ